MSPASPLELLRRRRRVFFGLERERLRGFFAFAFALRARRRAFFALRFLRLPALRFLPPKPAAICFALSFRFRFAMSPSPAQVPCDGDADTDDGRDSDGRGDD